MTAPFAASSLLGRLTLAHILPAFRYGLDPATPALLLEHVPLLDAAATPRRVVAAYLARGGFSALLRETRGLRPLRTVAFFARREWRAVAATGAAFAVRTAAGAAAAYAVEALLGVLAREAPGSRALARNGGGCVALLAAALVASYLASPTAWFAGTPPALASANVLFALGAAKTALLARHARGAGDAAQLLAKYAPMLLSNDVFTILHNGTWVAAASVAVGAWRVCALLGAAAGGAALATLAALTAAAFAARGTIKAWERAANAVTSARVAALQELFRGALALRALGWTRFFEGRVAALRDRELVLLARAQALRVCVDALIALTAPLAALAALLVFAHAHGGAPPPPAAAFAALAWLAFVTGPIRGLPALVQSLTDVALWLGKLRELLAADEAPLAHLQAWRDAGRAGGAGGAAAGAAASAAADAAADVPSPALEALEAALLCALNEASGGAEAGAGVTDLSDLLSLESVDVCAVAAKTGAATTLVRGVSLRAARGELVLVAGMTGSGKSSLLRAIIGDAPTRGGELRVLARAAAFVPQDPRLTRSSLRAAVCGGASAAPGDDAWYARVMRACALDADIAALPEGDATDVGDDGARLSGGQRARVALARALFSAAREGALPALFVLDDPFSAVDAATGEHLLREALGALVCARGHAAVVATHAVHFAARAGVACVLILGDGGVVACGAYADVARHVESHVALLEQARGTAAGGGGGGAPAALPAPAPAKAASSGPALGGGSDASLDDQSASPFALAWAAYAGAMGAARLVGLAALYMLTQALLVGQSFWLRDWVAGELGGAPAWAWALAGRGWAAGAPPAGPAREAAAATAFAALTGALALATLARLVLLTAATLGAGRVLHARALAGWAGAPGAAIAAASVGRALNRFERDVDHVDNWVRPNILLVATAAFSLLGSLAVVAASAPALLAWLAVVALLYSRVARLYARVVLRLRSLDAASGGGVAARWREAADPDAAAAARAAGPRAPAAAVAALLRALEAPARTKLAAAAGSNVAGALLYATGNSVTLAAAALALALVDARALSAPAAALLVTTAYAFNDSAGALVSNLGYLEQSAVSIARLAEFARAQDEDAAHAPLLSRASAAAAADVAAREAAAPSGARAASLRARGVGLRYSAPLPRAPPQGAARGEPRAVSGKPRDGASAPLLGDAGGDAEASDAPGAASPWALRGCSFDIPAGAKVAVVGRTGAGKSSLFAALLRTWPHEEGALFIGGLDVGALPRAADARALVAALPQGGFAFDGTLRDNLLGPLAALPPRGAAAAWLAEAWPDARVLTAIRAAAGARLADRVAAAGGLDARLAVGGAAAAKKGAAALPAAAGAAAAQGEWSRGERALLSVARLILALDISREAAAAGVALPLPPPARVILLDEPSADVDIAADDALVAALLARPETVLVIAHRREFLRRFDAVLEIDGGAARALCSPDAYAERV